MSEAWNTADKILLELMDEGYSAEIIMGVAARMGKGGVIWGEPRAFDPVHDVDWPKPSDEELEKRRRYLKEAKSWYGHLKDELEQWDD